MAASRTGKRGMLPRGEGGTRVAASAGMSFEHWRRYFLHNKLLRPEPRWSAPVSIDKVTRAYLGESLAHFQLGESGDGGTLLRSAKRHSPGAGFPEAAALFVAEEQEHARLLAHLVKRFGGALVTRHWTHTAFKTVRHLAGLDFEMQVLLVAETIGTAYYRLLNERCDDPAIRDACALILRDEEEHLRFHAEHVRARKRGRIGAAIFRVRLAALLRVATAAAWLDHGLALDRFGFRFRDFRRQVLAELRLFSEAPLPREDARAA